MEMPKAMSCKRVMPRQTTNQASAFSGAIGGRCFRMLSHAIGVVNEAIQEGIGQSWVCNNFVPAIQGD